MKCPGENPDQRPGLLSSAVSLLLPEAPRRPLSGLEECVWLGEGPVLGAEGGRCPCFIGINRKPCAWCFVLCLGSVFFVCGGGVRSIPGLITGTGNSLGRLVQNMGLSSKIFFF